MDIAAERAYPTPLANVTLLPMLLLSLSRQRHTPNTARSISTEYDYVIVGAGSAGSVVASRLSEKPCVTVLLLEAGGAPPLLTEVPGIGRAFWNTDIDWRYRTAPQRYTGRSLQNREVVWPSGKTLGGSSVLNAMLYVRGNRKNYDDWEAEGAEGWCYKDVLPYFKKMEDNRDPEYVANGFHGVGGPQTVHRPRYQPEIKDPIFEAAKDMGYKVVDPNGAKQTGFYDNQATMRSGQRCSTAKAYLVPAENRTNLDILPNAMVRKVLIQNRRAVGVQFDFQGTTYEVSATREVIMSAGTVNTAQLLMLSGIGPRKELERFKIPMIADLPVGHNLQDHCASAVNFVLNQDIPPLLAKIVSPLSISQYIQNRTGPLGSSEFVSVMAFLNKGIVVPNKDSPNYELHFSETATAVALQLGVTPEAYAQVFAPYEGRSAYSCIAQLLRPRSRGTVTLRSNDPYDPPIIDPNYLEDPKDIQDIVDGMKTCMRIGTSAPLRRVGSTPFQTTYPGCEKYAGNEDLNFWCQAQSFIFTLNHQVGTARMGKPEDPRTVVDPWLRVKTINGLRVVDASVMPIIPSGNTNIPTIMVAEKASDFIKARIKCPRDIRDDRWGETGDSDWAEKKEYPTNPDSESNGSSEKTAWKSDLPNNKWENLSPTGSFFPGENNWSDRPKVTPWNKEIPNIVPWNQELIQSTFLDEASGSNRSRPGGTRNDDRRKTETTLAPPSQEPERSSPSQSQRPVSQTQSNQNGDSLITIPLKFKNVQIQIKKTKFRPTFGGSQVDRPVETPQQPSNGNVRPPFKPSADEDLESETSCDQEFCSSLVRFMNCQEGKSCKKKREFATLIYDMLCS